MVGGNGNQDAVECRAIGKLLRAGQYAWAAEALHAAQESCEHREDAVLTFLLNVAVRLCAVCGQLHSEAERHLQAYRESTQRERELQQQLDEILDLIGGQTAPEQFEAQRVFWPRLQDGRYVGDRGLDRLAGCRGLWQRVCRLIGRRPLRSRSRSGAPLSSTPPGDARQAEEGAAILLGPGLEEPPPPAGQPEVAAVPEIALEPEPTPADVSAGPGQRPGPDEVPPPGIQEPAVRSLEIYCLGTFRVYRGGRPVEEWTGHKCRSVLKYLATHREQPAHVEVLMDLFWRDAEPDAARRNLYQAVYHLRRALQDGDPDFSYIASGDECYTLHPEVTVWVDSEALLEHYRGAQRLEREGRIEEAILEYEAADNLYEGEFLAEDRYEEWPLVQRENLKHAHMEILDRLSQHYLDRAAFGACTAFCQKILAEDRCREDAHRRLMRCYLRQGQRNLALHQYHLCEKALRQELDVEPMPATTALYRQIQDGGIQF